MTRHALLSALVLAAWLASAQPSLAAADLQAPRSIVFSRTTRYGTHIFRIEPDGSGLVRLTSGPSRDTDPAWSADGTAVAYTRRSDERTDIWQVDPDGSNPHPFITNARSMSWSEDGTMVAFVRGRRGNTDVWRADADGSNPVRLTTGPAWDAEPAWTVDGRILFTSDRSGRHRIYVMSTTGTGVERLTAGPGSQRNAAWSNTGRLVYEQRSDVDSDIYWLDPSSGIPHPEVARRADDREPAVAVDGELVFQRLRRDGSSVLVHTWVGDFPLTVLPSPAGTVNEQPGWIPSLAWIEAQDDQAKANLSEAAGTAQTIRDAEGSFAGAFGASMEAANPSLDYLDAPTASSDAYQVSIHPDDTAWSAALLSDSGECFLIRLEDGAATKYGIGSAATCTGSAAETGATDPTW